MARTYKAILRGDRVEWIDTPPPQAEAWQVQITLVEESGRARKASGAAMADALDAIAKSGGLRMISDPVEWQRETRHDRILPERDA